MFVFHALKIQKKHCSFLMKEKNKLMQKHKIVITNKKSTIKELESTKCAFYL